MNLLMHLRVRSYFLIAGMTLAFSACHAPDSKENVLANAIATNPAATRDVAATATSFILQSTDGGWTWQDISSGLPENVQPEGFFAGESDVYVHVNNVMYHSRSNLKTPVWVKENVPDLKSRSTLGRSATSIAFNHSGVVAFNHDGQIYQKTADADNWLPIHTNFKNQALLTVFETSDGMLFLGYDHGLYKSVDEGKNWKLVQDGPMYNIVESDGTLMASRGTGIMRSTDQGEHWHGIIREGRVGHFVERIDGGFVVVSDGTPTKPRKIRITLDQGENWKVIDEELPPSFSISSIKQVGKYLICGHPEGIFRSSDMGESWTRVYTAVEESTDANMFIKTSPNTQRGNVSKKIFTIYTSGNTFYAVAKIPGC